ncbi:hypothetical protein BGZ97_003878 [Linnemannia gamsii]|uniref:Uncharacterized protein n=1 Tax=Linnemannia gamsii TaxID=64522 RepID=A0A9P6UHE3_9FUNG|nr:hypothetical protein BGZ97_003878 [Linnemannia gamsii]
MATKALLTRQRGIRQGTISTSSAEATSSTESQRMSSGRPPRRVRVIEDNKCGSLARDQDEDSDFEQDVDRTGTVAELDDRPHSPDTLHHPIMEGAPPGPG